MRKQKLESPALQNLKRLHTKIYKIIARLTCQNDTKGTWLANEN
uniref:Uncharacterized protein n=1 Tax=Anguilla anguilla TaxID=7936 RepID=A0A0E9W992_ANGAN